MCCTHSTLQTIRCAQSSRQLHTEFLSAGWLITGCQPMTAWKCNSQPMTDTRPCKSGCSIITQQIGVRLCRLGGALILWWRWMAPRSDDITNFSEALMWRRQVGSPWASCKGPVAICCSMCQEIGSSFRVLSTALDPRSIEHIFGCCGCQHVLRPCGDLSSISWASYSSSDGILIKARFA